MRAAILALAIVLAGCSGPSAPVSATSHGDAFVAAHERAMEWDEEARLVRVVGFEWGHEGERRAAAEQDPQNRSWYNAVDRDIGDGEVFRWTFTYASPSKNTVLTLYVGPTAVLREHEGRASANYYDFYAERGFLDAPAFGPSDFATALVNDTAWQEARGEAGNATVTYQAFFEEPVWMYVLYGSGERRFMDPGTGQVIDERGVAYGKYAEEGRIFLDASLAQADEAEFQVYRDRDAITFALAPYDPFFPEGDAVTVVVTDPDGETTTLRMDTLLGETTPHATASGPAGTWTVSLENERSLIGRVEFSFCTDGEALNDVPACSHRP